MFRKLVSTAALVGAISLLVACGSSPSNKIAVTATDFKYDPMTWTVAANKPVNMTITNHGAVQHEWVLLKKGQRVTMPFDADDEDKVFWEVEAGPGESKSETFTAPTDPGTYEVVCGTPGHLEQSMEATLIVK